MDYLGLKGKLSKIEILDTVIIFFICCMNFYIKDLLKNLHFCYKQFDEADEDKDGLIDFDAFIKICANYKEALPDLLID